MAFKFKTQEGKVIWVGTNVFRISGLKSGVVRRFRKIQEDKKVTFDDLEGVLEKILAEQGLEDTKKWLRDNKFSEDAINELLVYNSDTKKIHARGELEDALAYEFFGVPKRRFPNVENLRGWVKNRVLTRDMKLKNEYESKTEKGKETMLKQLTYLFGNQIYKNGLSRQYTTQELDPHNPDRIYVIWQGRKHEVQRFTPKEYGVNE
tara:strand:+ start:2312 stop:2929 length:618 start_codon:yes stop_codon:yes gene_type:complete